MCAVWLGLNKIYKIKGYMYQIKILITNLLCYIVKFYPFKVNFFNCKKCMKHNIYSLKCLHIRT